MKIFSVIALLFIMASYAHALASQDIYSSKINGQAMQIEISEDSSAAAADVARLQISVSADNQLVATFSTSEINNHMKNFGTGGDNLFLRVLDGQNTGGTVSIVYPEAASGVQVSYHLKANGKSYDTDDADFEPTY